jgi:hypothetical protein
VSSTNDRTGSSGRDRHGFDKLAELERRYNRKDSPSPESARALKIGIEVDDKRFSFRPRRLRRFVPWLIAGLSFFGITGASVVGYLRAFLAGHAQQVALEAKTRELEDQLAAVKAVQASQARRLKTLEASEGSALVVRP